jgi:hypothetical protein
MIGYNYMLVFEKDFDKDPDTRNGIIYSLNSINSVNSSIDFDPKRGLKRAILTLVDR